MSGFLFVIILFAALSVSAVCAGLLSGMFTLNKYQLKRKAQFGDAKAKLAYGLHANRYQLMAVLVLGNIVATIAVVLLIESSIGNALIAISLSTLLILVFSELIPIIYVKKHVVPISARLYPVLHWLIVYTAPVTRPLGRVFQNWVGNEAQIFYSKEELLKIFDGQKLSENSDIAADEARMLQKVLSFGDKKIRDVMTPRRMATLVAADDTLGPQLLSELHGSGHSRFPVVREPKSFEFVGTLYLRDLALAKTAQKARQLMSEDVQYVHEEQSLDFALRMFLKTHHHLLVVVNNFEEFVGILSLEDVLEEVIGKEIVDEFDKYNDLRATAQSMAQAEARARKKNH